MWNTLTAELRGELVPLLLVPAENLVLQEVQRVPVLRLVGRHFVLQPLDLASVALLLLRQFLVKGWSS